MGLGIRTNISAWDLVRRLNASELALYSSLEKLTSGLAINRASDGPAILIISERLRSQIASLEQQVENLSAQQHKYEYASSALMELRSHLTELRSLAIGAANEGGNDEAMQAAYDTTAQDIVAAYNQVIETAEYNGRPLFDGSTGSLADIPALSGIDLTSAASAEASISALDDAVRTLDHVQIDLGATQRHELAAQQRMLSITRQNLIAAESELRDTDFVMEWTNFLAESMRLRAGIALFAHSRLNAESVLLLLND